MKLIDNMKNGLYLIDILLIIVLFLVQLFFTALSFYFVNKTSENIVKDIRIKIWSHILKLPVAYFDKNRSGAVVTNIIHDTGEILEFLNTQISSFFTNIVSIVGSIIILVTIDWKLAMLLGIAVPMAVLITGYFGNQEYKISIEYRKDISNLQNDLSSTLSKIRLVKATTSESEELKKESALFNSLYNTGVKEGKILGVLSPISSMVVMVLLVITFGYGTYRLSNGTLSNGALVASIVYLFQLADPFSQLISFFANYQKFKASVQKIQDVLSEPIEKNMISEDVERNITDKKGLFLENIEFSYNNDEIIFTNINYEFPLYKTTAIIGVSGAGKTTIFSLIERFYLPTNGRIFFDKKDIASIPLKAWRTRIAFLSQDTELSYGSLLENITYGVSHYSMDRLNELVEQFNLKSFVNSLDQGYETIIGEKGVTLSGGQRQRIALIRAILQDADIYLLDEPTSALDTHTEKLVQIALERYLKGKTVLIIAHRLKTIISADEIVILNNKTIEYNGTHNDLKESCELYNRLLEDSVH
jgi:multidrug ABC transporter ATP-binding protein